MENKYIFKSDRLGFRAWQHDDLSHFIEMNKNKKVMQYFPGTLTQEESTASYERFCEHFGQNGFGFYSVDHMIDQQWIGFIGMQHVRFESFFTPAVEIGYRLLPDYWGKGLATEGAKTCLDYGFLNLGFDRIVSITPVLNIPSQKVMQHIGMKPFGEFEHPSIPDHSSLKTCVLYEIIKK